MAATVAGWDGAVSYVKAPDGAVLPLLTFGLIWLVLVRGTVRVVGAGGVLLALWVWIGTPRPDLLVADTGGLIGIVGPEGRALSRASGSGFIADIWLENDGNPVPQEVAAARQGLWQDGRVVRAELSGWQILQVNGKTALAEITGCDGADILISNQDDDSQRPCTVFDIRALRQSGALAMQIGPDQSLRIVTARDAAGDRPWNRANGPAMPSFALMRQ